MEIMPTGRFTIRNAAPGIVACMLGLAFVVTGCGPSNQPTAEERQDKALRDPFGYSPDVKNPDMTVSGHGESNNQELKRDLDHVINP
jgi:hypothetical protein